MKTRSGTARPPCPPIEPPAGHCCGKCGTIIPTRLSKREREMVRLLLNGSENKLIAHQMGLTTGTVKVMLSRVYNKVGVTNRTELVVLTLQHPERVFQPVATDNND